MSRSRRKTPIIGIACCSSEKQDKRMNNRRHRRNVNDDMRKLDYEDSYYRSHKEDSNPWDMGKDGRCYFDADKWPNLMRK